MFQLTKATSIWQSAPLTYANQFTDKVFLHFTFRRFILQNWYCSNSLARRWKYHCFCFTIFQPLFCLLNVFGIQLDFYSFKLLLEFCFFKCFQLFFCFKNLSHSISLFLIKLYCDAHSYIYCNERMSFKTGDRSGDLDKHACMEIGTDQIGSVRRNICSTKNKISIFRSRNKENKR